jgi:hypothetical protein
MPWGSLLIADTQHARSERWLVAGRPQRDPWGLPLGDLPLDEAVAEYDRYGVDAAHLGSGPFVVADLASGRLLRAPSGIVPAFQGVGVCGPVFATADRVLRSLAVDVREISPGQIAGPSGLDSIADSSLSERLPLRWAWLEQEITARVAGLGPLRPARSPGEPDADADLGLSRTATGDLVFVPSFRGASGRAAALSCTIAAQLWQRARSSGRWLFAPMLERPVRDSVVLMSERARVEPGT